MKRITTIIGLALVAALIVAAPASAAKSDTVTCDLPTNNGVAVLCQGDLWQGAKTCAAGKWNVIRTKAEVTAVNGDDFVLFNWRFASAQTPITSRTQGDKIVEYSDGVTSVNKLNLPLTATATAAHGNVKLMYASVHVSKVTTYTKIKCEWATL